MPRGSLYYLLVLAVFIVTLTPSFLLACSRVRFRLLLAYIVGLGCGVVLLAIELHLSNGIWWDEVIYVLLLPIAGLLAGAIWRRVRMRKR